MNTGALDSLVAELEQPGDLDAAGAAELVDRCAELAARIGSELEQVGREAERDRPGDGQEQLL